MKRQRGRPLAGRRGVSLRVLPAGLVVAAGLALTSLPVLGDAGRPAAAGLFDRMGGMWPGTPAVADGPCAPYPYEVRVDGNVVACTHGPDPVPDGVRAWGRVSLDDLRARTDEIAAPTGGIGGGDVPCVGRGTTGLRTMAIYAYPSGSASRYDEIAPMIRQWAGEIDAIVDASAAQTGGSRHVRWLHDTACNLEVEEVALSSAAVYGIGVDPVSATVGEMIDAGFDRFDRRYLIWVDASTFDTGICGVALSTWDENPDQDNIHNGVPEAGIGLFGRVDRDCWGRTAPDDLVEAHELMHTLGAVQPNAPFSSSVVIGNQVAFYGHCIDEYDTMCYADGTPKQLVYVCPSSQERLLDCRHDTYFHTNPPSSSYLGTHWNTAMNAFLVRNDPIAGFVDVGAAFRADIAWLAGSGITAGCSADFERFCPNGSVTRGQMASFLARALELPGSPTDFFTDDTGSIHEFDINRVAQAGIATGCGGGRFCATAPVTRGQMAAFLDRGLALPPTSLDPFSDDDASPFEPSINRVAAAGITTGCTPTTYCPTATVTRGQMAAFLHRALVD